MGRHSLFPQRAHRLQWLPRHLQQPQIRPHRWRQKWAFQTESIEFTGQGRFVIPPLEDDDVEDDVDVELEDALDDAPELLAAAPEPDSDDEDALEHEAGCLPGPRPLRVLGADYSAHTTSELAIFEMARRMLASFVGIKRSHQEIWLVCAQDLLAPTLKRLSMFVLRAKAKLSDATAEVALYGLVGDGQGWPAPTWAKADQGEVSLVRLPDSQGRARALWLAPAGAVPDLPELDASLWQWLDVHSGVVVGVVNQPLSAAAQKFLVESNRARFVLLPETAK